MKKKKKTAFAFFLLCTTNVKGQDEQTKCTKITDDKDTQ